jgi:hypothetical protein
MRRRTTAADEASRPWGITTITANSATTKTNRLTVILNSPVDLAIPTKMGTRFAVCDLSSARQVTLDEVLENNPAPGGPGPRRP